MRRVLVVAVLATAACTTVPAPVVSPVPLRSNAFALSWAVAFSPARATIQRPDGTTQTLTANADHSEGNDETSANLLGAAFIPAMASWHFADGLSDGELYAGWRQLGVDVRVRLFETPGGTITSVVAGAKTHWLAAAADGSLALEVSPPLGAHLRALLRIGFGYGRRLYNVPIPEDLDTTAGHDNTFVTASAQLFRWDGRIEALIGLATDHLSISVQPYWVVYRGPIGGVSCYLCVSGVQLLDFSLDGGLALALTTRF